LDRVGSKGQPLRGYLSRQGEGWVPVDFVEIGCRRSTAKEKVTKQILSEHNFSRKLRYSHIIKSPFHSPPWLTEVFFKV
jgi:hypothetical protein